MIDSGNEREPPMGGAGVPGSHTCHRLPGNDHRVLQFLPVLQSHRATARRHRRTRDVAPLLAGA